MSVTTQALQDVLDRIDAATDRDARFAILSEAIITEGGILIMPHPCGTWGENRCLLSLHGVFASDPDPAIALDDWLKSARRVVSYDDTWVAA